MCRNGVCIVNAWKAFNAARLAPESRDNLHQRRFASQPEAPRRRFPQYRPAMLRLSL
jgi:hypothetical protein